MPSQITDPEIRGVVIQLNEKRNLLDNTLNENKQFEEVKNLFSEIRTLERMLRENTGRIFESYKHTKCKAIGELLSKFLHSSSNYCFRVFTYCSAMKNDCLIVDVRT